MRLQLYKEIFTIELRKVFSYRADFWVQFIGSIAAQIVIAYFLWDSIYSSTGKKVIGGKSFSDMLFYYLLAPLIGRVVYGRELGRISTEIYEGELNKYLIYPLEYLMFKWVGVMAQTLISVIQLYLVLFLAINVFNISPGENFVWTNLIVLFPICFLLGSLYFLMSASLEVLAFYADNVWSILVSLRFTVGIFGGTMLPLSLYSESFQNFLRFLPFEKLVYFPIQVILGERSSFEILSGVAALLFWVGLFYLFFQLMWKKAIKEYSGIGI